MTSLDALAAAPGAPAETAQPTRLGPINWRFKAAYGAGAIANGLANAAIGFFLLFYLTAVCGLSGSLAGAASFLALLVDAVADPAIGLASDRIRTRLGRRLPFMLASVAPFAAAFGLLFSIPTTLSGAALFLYVTGCLIVLRVSLSCFVLPFTAVGAEVTDDYGERSSIVSYRLTLEMAGSLTAVGLGLGVFMAGRTGLLSRASYAPFAWTCAAVILLTGLVAAGAVRWAGPRLHAPQPDAEGYLAGFSREMLELLRNRSFLVLFGTLLIYFLAYGVSSALALHAIRYFWKLDSSATLFVVLSTSLGPLLGAPVSAWTLRYVEKRTLAVGSFAAIAILQVWPPLAKLGGLLPASPLASAGILFTNSLLVGAAMMAGGVGFQSMMADTADEHEWLFGVRREGLFFSGLTLAFKAASGLGGLVAGVALDVIGFPTDLASKGATLEIPSRVLDKLALMSGPLPAALSALAPVLLMGYHLNRRRHAEIVAGLELRRGSPAQGCEASTSQAGPGSGQ